LPPRGERLAHFNLLIYFFNHLNVSTSSGATSTGGS
jgi:hypothetical protein